MNKSNQKFDFLKLEQNNSFLKIYNFLKEINYDFPTPLSNKCDLDKLAYKFDNYADVFVCSVRGEIIGLAAGYISHSVNKLGFVSVLGVKKEYRCLGIAGVLMEKMISYARSKRMDGLHLYTADTNTSALKLYEKIGFKQFVFDNEQRPLDIHLFYSFEGI